MNFAFITSGPAAHDIAYWCLRASGRLIYAILFAVTWILYALIAGLDKEK